MRVAVDARQVFRPNRRGIGKALVSLYRALPRVRPGWRFVLVHRQAVAVPELVGVRGLRRGRVDLLGADRFDLWERAVLPAAAWWHGADLLHAPANTAPVRAGLPVVVHVHDLIPLDRHADRAWADRVGRAARRARAVVTGSDYSRGRIVEALGVDANRVAVVPWAADPGCRPAADPAVGPKYGLPPGEPYLFGFGAADERKNTPRLIAAFAGLPAGVRGGTRLLLVGVQGPAGERFRQQAAGLGVGDRVRVAGYVPDADLPPLLAGAVALAYPSADEGFGLPVLDAFACGVPVLAGDRGSLPEVAGGAALLADPTDTAGIGRGLERLLTEPALRAELVRRGAERQAEYTWERTAEGVARVFERAAGG